MQSSGSMDRLNIDESCSRCQAFESVMVSLDCQHKFCITCLAFLQLKSQSNGIKDVVSCLECRQQTGLTPELSEIVQRTIKQTIVPKLHKYGQPIAEVSAQNINDEPIDSKIHYRLRHPQLNQKDKLIKRFSQDHSYDHITPSTKYFFSKCDSPAERDRNLHKDYCEVHSLEEASFVCLTCQNQLLCQKCVTSTKHKSHTVKNVRKGMELLGEKLSLKKLEINQRIEHYQMWQRRLKDKKQLIIEKWDRSKNHILQTFYQISSKLKRREAELLQICNQHYNSLELSLSTELEKLAKQLDNLSSFRVDLKTLTRTGYSTNGTERSERPSDFFSLYNRLRTTLDNALAQRLEPGLHSGFETVLWMQEKELRPLYQSIEKVCLVFAQHPSSSGTSSKKLHTKFTSLNSSRQKKKKYAKTEEDQMLQCGLKRKTEHNIDNSDKISRKGSNKKTLPCYVAKFLEKQHETVGIESSFLAEFDSRPKLNGSKMSSTKLLSRSIVPSQSTQKKKKERQERKTTNPLESLKNQKTIFETKRKKVAS